MVLVNSAFCKIAHSWVRINETSKSMSLSSQIGSREIVKGATTTSLTAVGLKSVRGERTLFDGLDLSIKEKQCLHVVGANGSGKTTLLRIIAGINRADQGRVTWNSSIGSVTENSAYLGHFDGLKNELSAAENLSFYHRLERLDNPRQIDDDLHRMGILACADLSVSKLSFGQRRRLAFARLLSANYKLWILDEPFTGIDYQGRELIEAICADHLQQQGMILLTNHQSLQESALAPFLIELNLTSQIGETQAK